MLRTISVLWLLVMPSVVSAASIQPKDTLEKLDTWPYENPALVAIVEAVPDTPTELWDGLNFPPSGHTDPSPHGQTKKGRPKTDGLLLQFQNARGPWVVNPPLVQRGAPTHKLPLAPVTIPFIACLLMLVFIPRAGKQRSLRTYRRSFTFLRSGKGIIRPRLCSGSHRPFQGSPSLSANLDPARQAAPNLSS